MHDSQFSLRALLLFTAAAAVLLAISPTVAVKSLICFLPAAVVCIAFDWLGFSKTGLVFGLLTGFIAMSFVGGHP